MNVCNNRLSRKKIVDNRLCSSHNRLSVKKNHEIIDYGRFCTESIIDYVP